MRILADENIPLLDEFFAKLGSITRVSGRTLSQTDVINTDVLLVRSVTNVNKELLYNTPVHFVGTCTIGTDHIDLDYLQGRKVGFASAPGCNAQAVADYVLSSLLVLVESREQQLKNLTVAVVGVGNVGSQVRKRLEALKVTVLGVDPFKREEEVGALVSLNDALVQADVVCLHTPLTTTGEYPTSRLIGKRQLSLMKSDACLLNAGRGPVVDNAALLAHLKRYKNFTAIMDVWDTEPEPNLELLERCLIATPHIAGYSLDGKMRGTEMIYQALCQHLGLPAKHQLIDFLPEPSVKHLQLSSAVSSQQALGIQMRAVYDVRNDDGRMRYAMRNAESLSETFDALRRNYPLRRDFSTLKNMTLN